MKQGMAKWGPMLYILFDIFNLLFVVPVFLIIFLQFVSSGFDLPLLLPVFISIALFLYVILSLLFGYNVLIKRTILKKSLKDWIKVNAYVTIIYSALQTIALIVVLAVPSLIQQLANEYNMPQSFFYSKDIAMIFCSIILILHALITFRVLRIFSEYFQ